MTRKNTTGPKFAPFKMLPKAVFATIMFQLFVQSMASTTTVLPSPSSSLDATTNNPSTSLTANSGTTSPSTGSASQSGSDNSSTFPTSTVTSTVTNTVTITVSSTITNIVWDSLTVSHTRVVSVTASSSVPEVEWYDWRKPNNCKEKCCDTGGQFIRQTRNCMIHRPRCNLTECDNYGPTERDTSCYTACSECMPSEGFIMAASGLITITAAIFISAMFVARP